MKKFSILSLALLLAAGTGFAGKSLPSGKALKTETAKAVEMSSMAKAPMAKKVQKRIPVAANSITGTYTWSCRNLLNGKVPGTLDIELVDESTGQVEITGWLEGCDFKVIGVVDYEKGTLTIPNNQYLGEDFDGYPTYFYIKGADEEGNVMAGIADVEATEGVFSGSGYDFYPYDIWALGDPSDEDAGWWFLTWANTLQLPFDEVQEGMWESVGPCTIEDAWILPSYTMQDGSQAIPSENPFTADLQRNVYNENLYRVWAPYRGEDCPLVGVNQSVYNGQIVFDITDPDHVIVKPGYYAGFANSNGEFCVFGLLGWQIAGYGAEWDPSLLPDLIQWMESKNQPFDTFKDNILTVNLSVFDCDINCTNAYTWNNNQYVVSKIVFPAGTGVNVEEAADAPVRYYNLQGVEIASPEAGQVVICRQGAKSVKKVIK